jgi:hypothetical protein
VPVIRLLMQDQYNTGVPLVCLVVCFLCRLGVLYLQKTRNFYLMKPARKYDSLLRDHISLWNSGTFRLLTLPALVGTLLLERRSPMSSLQSNLAPMNNRRRSQRVLLRIPIAVIAPGPDKQMALEQTHTLVVNAHGTLISLSLPVRTGQVVILQNPGTSEEESCRVIRVDPVREGKAEVALEFLKPAPNFWRVAFPPSDWAPHAPEITGDTF